MFACILCSGKFSTARKLRRHFRYDHKILKYDGLAVSVDTQMEVEDFMEPPPISINFAFETDDSSADRAMLGINRESCKYSPRTVATQTERTWRTPPLDFAQTRPCKPPARKRLFRPGSLDVGVGTETPRPLTFNRQAPAATSSSMDRAQQMAHEDPRSIGRLCSCETCIRHAIAICMTIPPRIATPEPVRCVKLPGLARSSMDDQNRWISEMAARPDAHATVCGCRTCVAHRILCSAIRAAHRVTPELRV